MYQHCRRTLGDPVRAVHLRQPDPESRRFDAALRREANQASPALLAGGDSDDVQRCVDVREDRVERLRVGFHALGTTPRRRVMVTALTPRVVHAAEPFMRATAEELLDAIPVPGTVDLVPAFTTPLPNRVTVHLLGFPPEDADEVASCAKEFMESGFPG